MVGMGYRTHKSIVRQDRDHHRINTGVQAPEYSRTTPHVNLTDIQVVKKFLLQDQYIKSYLP